MTRDEALERNIRRLLASTADPSTSTRKRAELPRALRQYPIETEGHGRAQPALRGLLRYEPNR
jgi:hypothetical protein